MNTYSRMSAVSLASIFFILLLGYSFLYITDKREGKKQAAQESVSSSVGKPYQDIIINNKVVKRGRGPDCASRYQAVKKILAQYKRPLTVLDIGAAEGYMSLRIAHDFDATCVMVEHASGESAGFLKRLCELNTERDNIILLYKKITADELRVLSQSEHFDIVLAFNVLHHFPEDKWEMAADAILAMADYAIIETPPVEDTGSIGKTVLSGIIDYLEKNKLGIIAKTSRRHTRPDTFASMYLLRGKNAGLKRRGVRGIRLTTFKLFNGVYPTKQTMKESIVALKKNGCNIVPQNLIIQGKSVISPFARKDSKCCDDQMMQYAYDIIDASDVREVMHICKAVHDRIVPDQS